MRSGRQKLVRAQRTLEERAAQSILKKRVNNAWDGLSRQIASLYARDAAKCPADLQKRIDFWHK